MPCAKDASRLARFFTMRPCRACESGWLDYFIWAEYYRVRYTVVDDRALLFVMKSGDEYFAALPYCAEEDLPHYFDVLRDFFNDVLEQPFKIYLADEEGVNALRLCENDDYVVPVEGMIDVSEMLIEQILLDFPYRHLCKEDCKGLCPKCGKDLNEGSCGCPTDDPDPRFDVLRKLLEDKQKKN